MWGRGIPSEKGNTILWEIYFVTKCKIDSKCCTVVFHMQGKSSEVFAVFWERPKYFSNQENDIYQCGTRTKNPEAPVHHQKERFKNTMWVIALLTRRISKGTHSCEMYAGFSFTTHFLANAKVVKWPNWILQYTTLHIHALLIQTFGHNASVCWNTTSYTSMFNIWRKSFEHIHVE